MENPSGSIPPPITKFHVARHTTAAAALAETLLLLIMLLLLDAASRVQHERGVRRCARFGRSALGLLAPLGGHQSQHHHPAAALFVVALFICIVSLLATMVCLRRRGCAEPPLR